MQFEFSCIFMVVLMARIAKCVGWPDDAIAATITLFRLHLRVILFGYSVLNDYKKTLLL